MRVLPGRRSAPLVQTGHTPLMGGVVGHWLDISVEPGFDARVLPAADGGRHTQQVAPDDRARQPQAWQPSLPANVLVRRDVPLRWRRKSLGGAQRGNPAKLRPVTAGFWRFSGGEKNATGADDHRGRERVGAHSVAPQGVLRKSTAGGTLRRIVPHNAASLVNQ